MSQPGQVEVGQLFLGPNRNGLKVWSQPGGIGTQVFPAPPTQFPTINIGYPSVVMSYPSLYILGCLHYSNCLEIFQYYDPYVKQVMVAICCGQCSYVQQIMPLAQYQSYVDTPIVVA